MMLVSTIGSCSKVNNAKKNGVQVTAQVTNVTRTLRDRGYYGENDSRYETDIDAYLQYVYEGKLYTYHEEFGETYEEGEKVIGYILPSEPDVFYTEKGMGGMIIMAICLTIMFSAFSVYLFIKR